MCPGERRHDMTGFPSTRTVQQPQVPSGAQPFLAEMMPQFSRSTSRRFIPSSKKTLVGLPFKMKCAVGMRLFVERPWVMACFCLSCTEYMILYTRRFDKRILLYFVEGFRCHVTRAYYR